MEYLSKVDPSELRMRITSDSDDPLVLENTKLTMQLTGKNGTQINLEGALIIDSIQDLSPDKGILSFGYQAKHTYALKLDEEGAASFKEIGVIMNKHHEERKILEEHGVKDTRKGSFTLGAAYDFRDRKEATLIIELLFDKKVDYFILLDKVKFPPELDNRSVSSAEKHVI
jgi:hypothetical protein